MLRALDHHEFDRRAELLLQRLVRCAVAGELEAEVARRELAHHGVQVPAGLIATAADAAAEIDALTDRLWAYRVAA